MSTLSSNDRTVDRSSLGPVGRSVTELRFFHLATLGIDPVALGECSQALLTILYCSTHRLFRFGAPVQNLSHSASFHSGEKIAPSKLGIKQLETARHHVAQDRVSQASEQMRNFALFGKADGKLEEQTLVSIQFPVSFPPTNPATEIVGCRNTVFEGVGQVVRIFTAQRSIGRKQIASKKNAD
ncbi:hypothetical protein IWQ51_005797 [Labrenzia sp. EL_142]|nr:hypothetical protein [Labrenzia sp. EL_142]